MNRRNFMRSATAISAVTVLRPGVAFGTSANSAVRVGIIGVGNRGKAVIRSMSENAGAAIIAAADLFTDKLTAGVKDLNAINQKAGFPGIGTASQYTGSKAYMRLLESKEIDAVVISTPAYAHPFILEAAVDAGKHAYCEKPAAIDVEGCKRIMRVSEIAANKLSVVTGFQIRYASPYVEMISRIQRGDIGEIISAQLYYFSSGVSVKPVEGKTFDEMRIRNHYHFNEISGGILLDQGIHIIDICNWALQSTPLWATGNGGKKGGPAFGNTWNNYQVIYKYPGDINVGFQSTQLGSQFGDVCARFLGTKGNAEAHYSGGVFINGEKNWDSGIPKAGAVLSPQQIAAGASLSSLADADKNKGTSFIKSIETGNYINQLIPGCESTLTAILGRQAAVRQEMVTWEEITLSDEKIDPMLDLSQFDQQ